MKSSYLPLLTLSVCLLVPTAGLAQRGGGNSRVAAANGWKFSLIEGMREGKRTGKPLMVVFRCEP